MNDRLLSAISLCRKAGKLRLGGDVAREEALSGGAKLMLLSADLAARSNRQTRFGCGERVPVRELPFSMEELSRVTGRRCGIMAVCDEGFAKMISGLLPPGPDEKT